MEYTGLETVLAATQYEGNFQVLLANRKKEKKKTKTVCTLQLTPAALADTVGVTQLSPDLAEPARAFSSGTKELPGSRILAPQAVSLAPRILPLPSPQRERPAQPQGHGSCRPRHREQPRPHSARPLLAGRLIPRKGFQHRYYCILLLFNDPLTTIPTIQKHLLKRL